MVWTGSVDNPRSPMSRYPNDWVLVIGPGLEVVIDRVHLGRRGTGELLEHDEHDDEDYYDETRDGYSVYVVKANGRDHGRCIRPQNAKDWDVIGE
jgi:hypothetical protein